MSEVDDSRIRQRAHEIWEREGRPEGRNEEHWAQARREVEAEERGSLTEPAESNASSTGTAPGTAGSGLSRAEAAPRSGTTQP